MESLRTGLTLVIGISWSIVYLAVIYRGFRDRTYGMPFFALALNISWEFIFAFVFLGGLGLQHTINITWFILDAIILYTYFRFGREDFPKAIDGKWFVPWSVLILIAGFVILYVAVLEIGAPWGEIYSVFVINLMMSVLFIDMLVRRDNTAGQSMVIAIFKWLGSLAATVLFYLSTSSELVLVLGVAITVFDMTYIGLLYRKLLDMGEKPYTR